MSIAIPSCGPDPPTDPDLFPDRWRTEAVLGLAFGIRADGAFDRLPILADALEDAGCDDFLLLNHCRYCAEHTPECWALECVVSNDQEFWTDAVWVAKGQPLPTLDEQEVEVTAATRQAKIDHKWTATVRLFGLLILAGVLGLIGVQIISSVWRAIFGG